MHPKELTLYAHDTYLRYVVGLVIGCNFMIDKQLQPTDRLSIMIGSSHRNWVIEVYCVKLSDTL